MKKKISLIVIVSLLTISIFASIVFAVEVTNETAEEMISTGTVPEDIQIPTEEGGNEYLGTSDITSMVVSGLMNGRNERNESVFEATENCTLKDETINGNVYIVAKSIVLENVIINGDLFVAGQRIEIQESASVNGTAFIAGQDLFINGLINRDLFAAGQTISTGKNSIIGYSAYLAGQTVNLKGNITRDANAGCTELTVESSASILGKLNYSSDKEGTIDSNSKIGDVNFSKVEVKERTTMEIITDYVMDFVKYFVIVMVALIFTMKFAPNFLEKTMEKVSAGSFGWGLLWIILIPICIFILFLMGITSKVAWVLLFLYIVSMLISNAVACIGIGRQIEEAHEKIKLPIAVALVATISWIVFQIPFIGGIVAFIMHSLGFGILLRSAIVKKVKNEE